MLMSATKVFCWNCEESVHSEANQCPYCGVNLGGADLVEPEAVLPPTYQPHQQDQSQAQMIPQPIYQEAEQINHQPPYQATTITEPPQNKSQTDTKINKTASERKDRTLELEETLKPMLLLLAGTVFFLFGFVLMLYSSDTYFTLRWDTGNWFYFLAPALPMLYYGWQGVQSLD